MSHFYVFSLNAWGNEENNFSNFLYHQDRFQRAILRRKLCNDIFFVIFSIFIRVETKKKSIFFVFFHLSLQFLASYDFSDSFQVCHRV